MGGAPARKAGAAAQKFCRSIGTGFMPCSHSSRHPVAGFAGSAAARATVLNGGAIDIDGVFIKIIIVAKNHHPASKSKEAAR